MPPRTISADTIALLEDKIAKLEAQITEANELLDAFSSILQQHDAQIPMIGRRVAYLMEKLKLETRIPRRVQLAGEPDVPTKVVRTFEQDFAELEARREKALADAAFKHAEGEVAQAEAQIRQQGARPRSAPRDATRPRTH